MDPIPHSISQFFQRQHILSLAAYGANDFWAATCFYVFDEKNARLIILTKQKTRHGQLMLENPHIVGTISNQTKQIRDISGVQFSATARCLVDEERKSAFQLYITKHSLAKLIPSDVWALELNEVKYSSNKYLFADKSLWKRAK